MKKVLTITISLIFALTIISCNTQQAKVTNSGNQPTAPVEVGRRANADRCLHDALQCGQSQTNRRDQKDDVAENRRFC